MRRMRRLVSTKRMTASQRKQLNRLQAQYREMEQKTLDLRGVIISETARLHQEEIVKGGLKLAVALNSIQNLSEGLQVCLDSALDISGMEAGCIYLRDKQDELLLQCHRGLSDFFVSRATRRKADSGMADLLRSKKAFFFEVDDACPLDVSLLRAEGLRFVAIVPVVHKAQPLGCLNITSKRSTGLEEWRQEALVTVAAHMAGAIQRLKTEQELLQNQERLRYMASELFLSEDRERRRLAVDLHDGVAQSLALLKMKTEFLKSYCPDGACRGQAAEISELLKTAIQETRSILYQLSLPILQELGLGAALDWLKERIESRHKIECRTECTPARPVLPEEIETFLFQAARELMTNAAKHADASRLDVTLNASGENLQLVVQDNGKGFPRSCKDLGGTWHKGFGLFSIQQRLACLGGSLVVNSEAGKGSRIVLEVPSRAH